VLSAEELLAGSSLTFEVDIPPALLPARNGRAPGSTAPSGSVPEGQRGSRDAALPGSEGARHTVRLRPLTVHDLQLITRAAKESDALVGTLMVQRALVEPEMSVAQVGALPIGLAQFLLQEVNRISGIATTPETLSDVAEAPLAKATFVLAREFGWTPQQVQELTLGQVLLHLRMLQERSRP
jgi:hypothetical protein